MGWMTHPTPRASERGDDVIVIVMGATLSRLRRGMVSRCRGAIRRHNVRELTLEVEGTGTSDSEAIAKRSAAARLSRDWTPLLQHNPQAELSETVWHVTLILCMRLFTSGTVRVSNSIAGEICWIVLSSKLCCASPSPAVPSDKQASCTKERRGLVPLPSPSADDGRFVSCRDG